MHAMVGRAVTLSILSFAVLMAQIADGKDSESLSTVLTVKHANPRLGETINVTLTVRNDGDAEATVSRTATAFDCFEVTHEDGSRAPYVGFMGQAMVDPVAVGPSSSVTIAENLELTDKYVFEKAGRYTVRFRDAGTDVPNSNSVVIDVAPGELSQVERTVMQLITVRPEGWHVAKSRREQRKVTPFGRRRVTGFSTHVFRSYMRGEAIYVWFTKTEAAVDPNEQPRIETRYLGKSGELHVYVAEADKIPTLWPSAVEDISRVMQIAK